MNYVTDLSKTFGINDPTPSLIARIADLETEVRTLKTTISLMHREIACRKSECELLMANARARKEDSWDD